MPLNEGRAKGPATAAATGLSPSMVRRRSTKAGRKARQPRQRQRQQREPKAKLRSTKAGRKARQPPCTSTWCSGEPRIAQRRPGERPGNRPSSPSGAARASCPLNEGRAKGPATALPYRQVRPIVPCSRSTKAGRKARQPRCRRRRSLRQPRPLNEGRAKGPATAPTDNSRCPSPSPTLNEGRAKGPATAAVAAGQTGVDQRRSTKAGRKARQPPCLTFGCVKGGQAAQRRPGERPGNRA